MAFCTKCGAELKKDAVFCTQCGARVAPETPVPKTPVPETPAPKAPAPETPVPESQASTAREPIPSAPAAPGKKAGASKRMLIMAAIALLVAIAGVAIAAFLVTQQAKSDARDEQTSLWLDYGAQTERWLEDMDDRQERLILTAGEETELDSALERIETDLSRELDWDSADTPEEAEAIAQEAVETQKQDLERRMDDIGRANEGQVRTLRAQLEGEELAWAVDSDLTEIETLRGEVDAKAAAGDYRGAWEALGQWQDAALRASTAPRGFNVSMAWYDLSDYPTVRAELSVTDGGGRFVSGLGQDAFYVNERRSAGGSFTRRPVTRVSFDAIENNYGDRFGERYLVEFEVEDGRSFDERFYLDFQVRADDGRGGVASGCAVEPEDFFEQKYYKFLKASLDCQTKGERNLLESGVITTNSESYSNHDCLAWQSEETIRTNGPGSDNSDIFEELTDYEVLEVRKDGDGYILYGLCELDVSQTKTYDRCREKEKEVIAAQYGDILDENATFWIEESIYNYEKLTLIRDTDGKWKFHTRVYERPSGSGSAYGINEVYQISMQ